MFLLYFILWIVFTDMITVESCLFGLAIAAAIFAFICKFMDYSLKKELLIYRKTLNIIGYLFVLIIEIVKANITVMRIIVSEKEEVQPVLVSFKSDLKTPTARAFFANAITLTPGTITVTLEGNEYVVHCLDESLAESIDDSICAKKLKKLETYD